MTAHRFIQVHNLIDNCESLARSCLKAAESAISINNKTASKAFIRRAMRLTTIAQRASARLQAAA